MPYVKLNDYRCNGCTPPQTVTDWNIEEQGIPLCPQCKRPFDMTKEELRDEGTGFTGAQKDKDGRDGNKA